MNKKIFFLILLLAAPSYAARIENEIGLGTYDNRYVNVTGDTMTGSLTLSYDNPELFLDDTTSGKKFGIRSRANSLEFIDRAANIRRGLVDTNGDWWLGGTLSDSAGAGANIKILNNSIGIKEAGATPIYYSYFQGGDQAADITYTLPTASANGFLKNASNVLSWSSIDISSDTNLAVTAPIVLTDDTLSHSADAGYIHLPTGGTANQLLINSGVSGTGTWGTITESSGALNFPTVSAQIVSGVADGATAVSTILNSTNTLITAGSLLLSVRNNGTQEFSISAGGNVTVSGDILPDTDNVFDLGSDTKRFGFGYFGDETYFNNTVHLVGSVSNSPTLTLQDKDTKLLTLAKSDDGQATITNTEGPIHLSPSGDLNDYFVFATILDVPTLGTTDDTDLLELTLSLLTVNGSVTTTADITAGDDLFLSTKGVTIPGANQYVFNVVGALTSGLYFSTTQAQFQGAATAYHWWEVSGTNIGDFEMGNGTNKVTFDASVNLMDVTGGIRAGQFYADADSVGIASTISLTKTSDLTANSTGVGTILFKGATSRNSSGFIKIYIGTTAYYIPVFSDITG